MATGNLQKSAGECGRKDDSIGRAASRIRARIWGDSERLWEPFLRSREATRSIESEQCERGSQCLRSGSSGEPGQLAATMLYQEADHFDPGHLDAPTRPRAGGPPSSRHIKAVSVPKDEGNHASPQVPANYGSKRTRDAPEGCSGTGKSIKSYKGSLYDSDGVALISVLVRRCDWKEI